nr:hypothetical protein DA06_23305 [Georgenia sp. SUBG003]
MSDIVERVRHRAPHGADDALTFLEADPWCFRSGYAKERLLRALGTAEFTEAQRRRGAAVVRSYVLGPDRREFRPVGELARALDDEVRPFLLTTLSQGTPVAARHALWLLMGLSDLDPASLDLPRAREVLLGTCTSEDLYYRQMDWLTMAARRLRSDEWIATVTAEALGTGAPAPLRLLAVLPGVQLSPEQQQHLGEFIINDIASGKPTLPVEELGNLCGHPELDLPAPDRAS